MMSVSAQYNSKVVAQNPSISHEENEQNKSKSLENQMDMSSHSEESKSDNSASVDNMNNQGDLKLEEEDTEVEIPEESKISKTLSDKTIKTVVMLVLLLLFMLAICSSEAYVDNDIIHVQGLKNLRDIYDRGEPFYKQY